MWGTWQPDLNWPVAVVGHPIFVLIRTPSPEKDSLLGPMVHEKITHQIFKKEGLFLITLYVDSSSTVKWRCLTLQKLDGKRTHTQFSFVTDEKSTWICLGICIHQSICITCGIHIHQSIHIRQKYPYPLKLSILKSNICIRPGGWDLKSLYFGSSRVMSSWVPRVPESQHGTVLCQYCI